MPIWEGEAKIENISGNRFYILDNCWYPSVTSILKVINKPGLMYWYGNLGTKKAEQKGEQAADLGTRLHKAIEIFLRTGKREFENDLQNMFISFERYFTKSRIRILSTERIVYSLDFGFAGTTDAITSRQIVDFKTSKGFYKEYWIQTAMYAKCLGLNKTKIIRIDKETAKIEAQNHGSKEVKKDFKAAMAAKDLWEYMNLSTLPREYLDSKRGVYAGDLRS